jgi:hypothetical protein
MTIARLADGVGTGLIFYNGFTFSPAAATVGLSALPLPDSSGRTVKAVRYTFKIHDYLELTGGLALIGGLDGRTPSALAKLCKPAGVFRYRGRGFGDLAINTGKKWDAKWGPWPKVSNWQVKAGNGSVTVIEFDWEVEVVIPNCEDATFKGPGAFLERNFSVAYAIDRAGYTTKTTTAHLTVPQTRRRVDARLLEDHADLYRESLRPALPPNFRRASENFGLSEDKCTLTAVIVDEQLPPNLPPPGVIEARAEHSYQSIGMARWTGTLSAEYELARESVAAPLRRSVAGAILAFQDLLFERVSMAETMIRGRGLPGDAKILKKLAPGNVVIIPHTASASEVDVYGRTKVRISASYLACGVGLVEILERGGLWRRPGFVRTNPPWETWVSSVYGARGSAAAWGGRGHAQLAFGMSEDKIEDLCGPARTGGGGGPPGPLSGLTTSPPSVYGRQNAPPGLLSSLGDSLRKAFPAPDKLGSWIEFRADVTVRAHTGAVVGTTLPTAPLTRSASKQATWDVYAGLPAADEGQSAFPPLSDLLRESQTAGEVFVQQRTKPALYLTFSGVALRAGYTIPVPEVVSVNGKRPVLVGEPWFRQSVVANTIHPIVAAGWSQTFVFTDDEGVPTRAVPPVPVVLA